MMDWLCNSLLHWLDIWAGYEMDFLPKKSPLFQFEIAFTDIWIFLTPKGGRGGGGGGGDICFLMKNQF